MFTGDTLFQGGPGATGRSYSDAGLIVDVGTETRRDALGSYRVPAYAMPIPVHMAWCSAVAATDEEMAAFEAGRGSTA